MKLVAAIPDSQPMPAHIRAALGTVSQESLRETVAAHRDPSRIRDA